MFSVWYTYMCHNVCRYAYMFVAYVRFYVGLCYIFIDPYINVCFHNGMSRDVHIYF